MLLISNQAKPTTAKTMPSISTLTFELLEAETKDMVELDQQARPV